MNLYFLIVMIYFICRENLFVGLVARPGSIYQWVRRTEINQTKIWNSLYNFQHDAAVGAIKKLELYNGCIIADSVGSGKTFEVLVIIKYYELVVKEMKSLKKLLNLF